MSGPLTAAIDIFDRDITPERWRQHKTWGLQTHPDGTGCPGDKSLADWYRRICEEHFAKGDGTWRHILAEEVAEAFAESERLPLRAELVQVAAVAIAWIECLDRRAGDREPLAPRPLSPSGFYIPSSREMVNA